MNDDQLSSLFAQADDLSVDENAKQQAINLAKADFIAFQAEQKNKQKISQGFIARWRHIARQQLSDGSNKMQNLSKKFLFGGAAGAAVSVLAWVVLVDNTKPVLQHDPSKPEVVQESGVAPQLPLADGKLPGVGTSTKKSKTEHRPPIVAAEDAAESAIESAAEGLLDENVVTEEVAIQVEPEPKVAAKPKRESITVVQSNVAPAPVAKRKMEAFDGAGAMASRAPLAARTGQVIPIPKPIDVMPPQGYAEQGRDQFENVAENSVKLASENPISTFSVDVDTASYSFVRSALNRGVLPQKNAVRIEELVNYFDYAYPLPEDPSQPFKPTVAVMDSPWSKGKKLLHIGVKGFDQQTDASQRKTNLIFLLDVSGSMNAPDKLPLVKQSMSMLLNSLSPMDKVGIVVYAGAAGTVLEPTLVSDKQKILNAMNRLQAGGSTAGGEGIKLAYQLAEANFDKAAVNRIILATDGDFNVGIKDREALKSFVERKREKGVLLSVLGFGRGNYNDHLMQTLAQNGNGVAAYIDTLGEAQKVLVNEASSTLFPIAKDVKIQLEFNPATVAEYRLIGYETRRLQREDFNNDKVDAGDIGAGHTVTAIYEITPQNSSEKLVDAKRYGDSAAKSGQAQDNSGKQEEYGFLKIRYKLPQAKNSELITYAVPSANNLAELGETLQRDIRFAAAVTGFAQLLKTSKYVGTWNYDAAIALAQANKGEDDYGYRTELVQLIRKAKVAEAM